MEEYGSKNHVHIGKMNTFCSQLNTIKYITIDSIQIVGLYSLAR